jgi:hypothetical protein
VRNRKETEEQQSWTIEAGESDDLPQFRHDKASMRKDGKQRRSHKKNRVAGKCGSGEKNSCAADFSLLNLPKGKSLGRSKPATNS